MREKPEMGDGQVPARLLLVHVASLHVVEKATLSTQGCKPAPFPTFPTDSSVVPQCLVYTAVEKWLWLSGL